MSAALLPPLWEAALHRSVHTSEQNRTVDHQWRRVVRVLLRGGWTRRAVVVLPCCFHRTTMWPLCVDLLLTQCSASPRLLPSIHPTPPLPPPPPLIASRPQLPLLPHGGLRRRLDGPGAHDGARAGRGAPSGPGLRAGGGSARPGPRPGPHGRPAPW